MAWNLAVSAHSARDHKSVAAFEKNALLILKQIGFKSASLSVLLVRDRKMASLNWKMMKHKGTTDVLSFSYLERKGKVRLDKGILDGDPPVHLGDVVVCLATAERNAQTHGVALEYECALYLCHGILHCLGFDDKTPQGFKEMKTKQEKILTQIGIEP